jgi:putative hydrolase of the HAD superfamily
MRRALDGAIDLLVALRPHVRIGIVSNNLLDEQREKLALCGFEPFVDALVVSEEAGMSKPDPRIFHLALDRLGVPADSAVMVGDSWPADIVGARAAGVRAIWFNPRRLPRPDEPEGVPEIASLAPAVEIARTIVASLSPGPEL